VRWREAIAGGGRIGRGGERMVERMSERVSSWVGARGREMKIESVR